MRGIIINAMKELIIKNYGDKKWEDILQKTGLPKTALFYPSEHISDDTFYKMVQNSLEILNLEPQKLFDAFGEYWVCEYAPRIFTAFYRNANNAKDFLLNMSTVHERSTRYVYAAEPPRFEYRWINDKTLIMKYISRRGLIDVMIGLIKGVGKFYKEDLKITKLSNEEVQIVFH